MSRSATEHRLEQKFQLRLYFFSGFILISLALFVFQLGKLQLVWGYENRILAKKFVSQQEFMVAPRGLIYDRSFSQDDSRTLVQNVNYIDYVVFPNRFRNRAEGARFIGAVATLLGRNPAEFREYLSEKAWNNLVKKNQSIILLTRVGRREQERLAEFHLVSRYGEFVSQHLRYYTMGPALAHVTGYIGLPSRRELERKLALPYQFIGKAGLEAQYDSELRGSDGVRIRHRIKDSEEQIAESRHGNSLVLTIDHKVQAAAYRKLVETGKRGTAIAMRTNGEVLALASYPAYDPNILASGSPEQRAEHFGKVQQFEGFLNLAVQAKSPPASTFKILVAIAALESGKNIDPNTTYTCNGSYQVRSSSRNSPDAHYNCWSSGHGSLNLLGAIAQSCNVYFWNLSNAIGPSGIIKVARGLGLDRASGIDLPGEISGFVPDQRWKQINWSSRWYDGDTLNLAVGQGFLEATPLGMAVALGAVVNRGKIYKPFLVRDIRDPDTNRVIKTYQPHMVTEIPMAQDTLDLVEKGMRMVIQSGTGRSIYRPDMVPIAGKTGTAQTRSKREGKSHAWFVGYGPYEGPPEEKVVVSVFVEFGKGGALSAAPIAMEMLRAAFPNYQASLRPEIKKIQPET
ncbi:MAG: penicillin-binding protein 2 [Spirochaetales bacterium]|nr:penicillin-binding protein 2 [Spirochaetales bacterium]